MRAGNEKISMGQAVLRSGTRNDVLRFTKGLGLIDSCMKQCKPYPLHRILRLQDSKSVPMGKETVLMNNRHIFDFAQKLQLIAIILIFTNLLY